MIRWWVNHPINQDSYCVYIVRDDPNGVPYEDQWQHYWKGDEWHAIPIGGILEPAITLPGRLVHDLVGQGRENVDQLVDLLQDIANEVWEQTTREREGKQ